MPANRRELYKSSKIGVYVVGRYERGVGLWSAI